MNTQNLTLLSRLLALLVVCLWAAPAGVSPGYIVSFPFALVFTLLAAPLTLTVLLEVMWFIWETHLKRRLFTWLIRTGEVPVQPDSGTLRREFGQTPMPVVGENKRHTHGKSASLRSTARKFMADFSTALGLKPFQVQQSTTDQKHGTDGSRTYYWSKDITVDPSFATPGPEHIVCFTDVDYYVDMPWFLAWFAKPVLLYTVVPSQVAKDQGEYAYTFDAENNLVYTVAGGASYRHKLWNYGADNLVSTWRIAGIPIITTTYVVERRNVGVDHQVILLAPTGYWYGPFAWLAEFLSGYRLQRLQVVAGEFLRLQVKTKAGLETSTGRILSYNSAKVPTAIDDAIASVSRMMKVDITTPTVLTYLDGDIQKRPEATALCEFHRANPGHKPDTVFPVDQAVNNFSFSPERYDPAAKPSLRAFMSPLIAECYAPTNCLENDERCIDARLNSVKSDAQMPQEYMQFVNEYVELLVPHPHRAGPCDVDTVYERQNRPTQRALLDLGSWFGPNMTGKRHVEAFQKAEAYAEVKDPRNISTINPRDKLDYSRYTYVAAEVLKATTWYAFGLTPRQIAWRVAAVCLGAKCHALNSDLSRFDGRLSYAFRTLEIAFLKRLFRIEYHREISDLHNAQFDLRGYTKFGVGYETGASRLSGSPETALFNSLDNAFMVFVSFRRMGLSPSESWARLGVYGGDDGLTADIDVNIYKETVASFGMKSTTEVVQRGQFGIKFLARIYGPHVWNGAHDSCCDLPRQLSKFHATAQLPPNVTPEMKLIEKARGFFLSDRNTPIIGRLATKVMMLTCKPSGKEWLSTVVRDDAYITHGGTLESIAAQSVIDHAHKVRHYGSLAAICDQYPNEDEGWMDAYVRAVIPTIDVPRFEAYLSNSTTLKQLLSPPLIAQPPATITVPAPVVVNETVFTPAKPTSPAPDAAPLQAPPPPPPAVSTAAVAGPVPVAAPISVGGGVAQRPDAVARGKSPKKSKGARRRANAARRKALAATTVARSELSENSPSDSLRGSQIASDDDEIPQGFSVGAIWVPYTRPRGVDAA